MNLLVCPENSVCDSFAHTKASVFAPMFLYVLLGMVFPTVTAISARLTPPDQQVGRKIQLKQMARKRYCFKGILLEVLCLFLSEED